MSLLNCFKTSDPLLIPQITMNLFNKSDEMGLTLQVVSDLHMEYQKSEYAKSNIPRSADYLVLAGDTGSIIDQQAAYTQFIERLQAL